MAVAISGYGEVLREEMTVVGSSTSGASEQPMQNVQRNPEKDPAETADKGTVQDQKQDQKQDQHEGEQQ